MTGRKSRSQPMSSGNKSTDLPISMDSGAYDDESLKPNKTAAYHQSTSIETRAKYPISVLGRDPFIQSSLVDNCLENLKVEAEKKQISQHSKQSAESDKVLIVKEESSESKYNAQKGPSCNHIHLHFNAPVTNISLDIYMKPSEKACQSDDNLPQIQVKVHSPRKMNSSRSPEAKNYKYHVSKSTFEAFTSDGQRNVAVKRKSGEDDEESNSSQTSRYSKMSKRRKSRSVSCEKNTVENEETSKETATHIDDLRKQFSNRRNADGFDSRNCSRKKEVVKSNRNSKSKSKKNEISKSQRTLSQWTIWKTPDSRNRN